MFNHPTQSFRAPSGFRPAGTLEGHCPSIQGRRKGYGGFAKKSTGVTHGSRAGPCLLRENWSAELVPTEPVSPSSSLSAPIWKAGRLPYSPGKPLENCPRGVFSQLLLAALRAAVPFLKRSEKSATESRPRVVQREILVRGATAKGQKAFSKETGYFSKASNGSRPTSPMLVCELQGVKRHSPSAWHTVLETS